MRALSGGGVTTLMPPCWSFSATPVAPPWGPAHTPCRYTAWISDMRMKRFLLVVLWVEILPPPRTSEIHN